MHFHFFALARGAEGAFRFNMYYQNFSEQRTKVDSSTFHRNFLYYGVWRIYGGPICFSVLSHLCDYFS